MVYLRLNAVCGMVCGIFRINTLFGIFRVNTVCGILRVNTVCGILRVNTVCGIFTNKCSLWYGMWYI